MEVIRERERYVVVTVAVQLAVRTPPVQVAVKQLLVCWTLDTHTVVPSHGYHVIVSHQIQSLLVHFPSFVKNNNIFNLVTFDFWVYMNDSLLFSV